MKTGEDDTFLKHLQDALNSDPDNPSHHYNLGIFLWEKGGESKECMDRAVEHFISAAKLNPSNGPAFRFLGHYYRRVSFDSQRASKCYHRAVTLNPDDVEAGEGLCDLLDEEGKESLEVAVCREASEKSPRAFWAFRRLGYMQVHQKKWSEAVPSLQHAIRGYPTCADLWEALGLAYQRLGMFTASLKSYGRATELEDSRIFSLIESGNILLMLGSFAKGVEQFRLALKIEPNSIAAQYGLASGLLGFSRDCVNSGAFVWGSALLEEASDVAKANTCLAGNISSSWKLHGDIQMAYSKCFPWEYEGKGLETDEDSFKISINSWKRKRLLAAVTANRSYQRALHLTPWQANFYTDISISLDLIDSLEEKNNSIFEGWQLPEKMSLGGLMLEGDNNEFWVVLGCLSTDNALKQHAFIRGLQLDVSDAVAWAYLGKLYRKVDEKLLARQAFDHARSIDPSLALPWAGMSIDTSAGSGSPEDAYESCLRAAYIMPLAEFQLGLGKLAVRTGHLLFPQVFGALQQAVQRAPYYPESHNLNGLAYEARSDYESAVSAYRNARNAMNAFTKTARKSHFTDISVNLARSLCQAGNAHEAACECEDLEKTGLLDNMGLQIYAVALWKLGRNDLALSVAKKLASNAKTMSSSSAVGPLELICKLMYNISGMSSTTANILKFPKDLFQGTKISSIVAVLSALDESGRLRSLVLHLLASPDVGVGFHSLLALGKLIRHGSEHCLGVLSAVAYLKKVLHIYPDSSLIRNHLSTLLLSSKEWKSSHNAIRCVTIEPTGCPYMEGAKSGNEILGSAAVACYASCTAQPKFSFPTCESQCMHRAPPVQQLQKWLHQEPCNNKARYLLVLSMLQKAREEKFPQHLCITLKRLVFGALSSEIFSKKDQPYEYQKFQLLLCASEICMQDRDYVGCIDHATTAMKLPISSGHLFFAHLQLCRAYAVQEDFSRLKLEYEKCMQLETDYHIGWISLKFIEARYKQQIHLSAIDAKFEACLEKNSGSQNQWVTIMDLVHAQNFMWDQDFLQAEQALMHGCSLREADFCLFLCHGTICMELARQRSGSHFLSLAANSLTRAQESSPVPLPIVSAVLAQAEASLGSRAKWERNLRIEWYSWPAEMRPAEVYFQMHLLARQSTGGSHCVELSQSPLRWILRAIHCNPSCSRYWRVLDKPGR